MSNEIVKVEETWPAVVDAIAANPQEARSKLAAIAQFQAVVQQSLQDGVDYGVIPGTDKPTLLQAGAQKVVKILNLAETYDIVERVEDWDKGFFYYMVKTTLRDIASGSIVASGIGSANSMESKWRFRWVSEADIPVGVDKAALKKRGGRKTLFEPDFALKKRETSGTYGKPEEYWAAFDAAIKGGKARKVKREMGKAKKTYEGYEITVEDIQYQAPNPYIHDQVNTILKISKKRSFVDAALSAGRLSNLFTQDLEELEHIIEAERRQAPPRAKPGVGEMRTPAAEDQAWMNDAPDPDDGAPDDGFTLTQPEEENGRPPVHQAIDRMIATLVDNHKMHPGDIFIEIKAKIKEATGEDYTGKIPGDFTPDLAERVHGYLKAKIARMGKKK